MINQVPVTHAKGHVFHQERLAGVRELNAVHCAPMSGVSEATFWLLLCTKNLKEFWSFLGGFLGSCRISDKPDHLQDFALMKHEHSWAKKFSEKPQKRMGPQKILCQKHGSSCYSGIFCWETLESDIQLDPLCCHSMKTAQEQPKNKELNLPGLQMPRILVWPSRTWKLIRHTLWLSHFSGPN